MLAALGPYRSRNALAPTRFSPLQSTKATERDRERERELVGPRGSFTVEALGPVTPVPSARLSLGCAAKISATLPTYRSGDALAPTRFCAAPTRAIHQRAELRRTGGDDDNEVKLQGGAAKISAALPPYTKRRSRTNACSAAPTRLGPNAERRRTERHPQPTTQPEQPTGAAAGTESRRRNPRRSQVGELSPVQQRHALSRGSPRPRLTPRAEDAEETLPGTEEFGAPGGGARSTGGPATS